MMDHLINMVIFFYFSFVLHLSRSWAILRFQSFNWRGHDGKCRCHYNFHAHSQLKVKCVPPCMQSMSFITIIVKQRNQISLGTIRLMSLWHVTIFCAVASVGACHWWKQGSIP